MKPVLTPTEMYFYDHWTINKFGLPGVLLMETAGQGCAQFINAKLNKPSTVAVVCGSGNNGGDGFVIARWLHNMGHTCLVYLVGDEEKMSAETKQNYLLCQKLQLPIVHLDQGNLADFSLALQGADAIVDAIFGVGFKGTPRGISLQVIDAANNSSKCVFAVDVPSGLCALTGLADICVNASYTLTMAAVKTGHLFNQGPQFCGQIKVIDIGIPALAWQQKPPAGCFSTYTQTALPMRKAWGHKGDFGRIGIIAGSAGYCGAAIMAARAALRSGAGLVTLFGQASLMPIYQAAEPHAMFSAIGTDDTTWQQALPKLQAQDILLVGPGLGQNSMVATLLQQVFSNCHKPLVLDADALNCLATNRQLLSLLNPATTLVTPHPAEFARLCNLPLQHILHSPQAALQDFYQKTGLAVLLKGHTSIFYNGGQFVYSRYGNDALAKGGSGDVLSGIVASFIGQGLPIEHAALAAAKLMGTTAEKLTQNQSGAGILADDIIANLFT